MKNLIILSFFVIGSIKAQTWEENELINNFSDKIVYDIGFINNNILVLSNYGLSILNDSSINQYWFKENSAGSLNDFLINSLSKKQNFDYIFSSLIIEKEIVWMFSRDFKIILKIENGMVQSYKFDFLFNKQIYPKSISAYNSSLWFFFEYYDSVDNKQRKEIYYLKNGDFIKYQFYNSKTLDLFFVRNGYKYFVFQENFYENELEGYFVAPVSNDSAIRIIFRNKSHCNLNFYCIEEKVYILSDNYNLIKLSQYEGEITLNNYFFFSSNLNKIHLNFEFLFHNDKLYIPSMDGLFVFDFNNLGKDILKPKDFYDNCFSGFDKVKLQNSNQLWLIYGNGLKYNCENKKFGFSIYNITK